MALPKLSNDRPIYEMVIPSTKETVQYRPFLVKEQKNLLVAFESQDPKQILSSMVSCIDTCVEKINIRELSTFDVDYIFTKIRSKSVGETSKVLMACENCNEENEVTIKLDNINMGDISLKNTSIPINDDITVEMKYPTYEDMLKNEALFNSELNAGDMLIGNVMTCMHAVQTKEENLLIREEPKEEVETFLNSLTNEQLQKLVDFVESVPTLSHTENYNCKKCGKENTVTLKGIQDFF